MTMIKNKFDLQEFRSFVESKIINIYSSKRSFTKDQILDSICQFEVPGYIFLDSKIESYSKKFKRIFRENLQDKPKNVRINIYFLYQFGFKKCYSCKNIQILDNYYPNNNHWDKLSHECRYCYQKYRDDNKEHKKQYQQDNKEGIAKYRKQYYEKNKAEFIIKALERQTNLKNLIPDYLTKKDLKEIKNIYNLKKLISERTGVIYHVDHVICIYFGGLHAPWNLAIVPADYNIGKHINISDEDIKSVLINIKERGLPLELKYLTREDADFNLIEQIKKLIHKHD